MKKISLMQVEEFLRTLYFGDRWCMEAIFDSSNKTYTLHFDSVSIITGKPVTWKMLEENDISGALLVFENVYSVVKSTEDFQLNDDIYEVAVVEQLENGLFVFRIDASTNRELSKYDEDYQGYELITASNVYLIDPQNPDKKICAVDRWYPHE